MFIYTYAFLSTCFIDSPKQGSATLLEKSPRQTKRGLSHAECPGRNTWRNSSGPWAKLQFSLKQAPSTMNLLHLKIFEKQMDSSSTESLSLNHSQTNNNKL